MIVSERSHLAEEPAEHTGPVCVLLMQCMLIIALVCGASVVQAETGIGQPAASEINPSPNYSLSLAEDGSTLTTAYCFNAGPVSLNAFESESRMPIIAVELIRNGKSEHVAVENDLITVPGLAGPACIRWQSDMTKLRGNRYQQVLSPAIRMVPIADWLWLPGQGDSDNVWPTRVAVELLPGQSVSAPWSRQSETSAQVIFEMPGQFNGRRGFVIIGKFHQQTLSGQLENNTPIDLAILQAADEAASSSAVIQGWLEHHLANARLAFGQVPVDRLQVIALPIDRFIRRSGEHRGFLSPVPWAEVLRGGGSSIMTVLDSSRSLQDFRQDWTLTHELSHLLHPVMDGRDRWLYEGIGTYYQNVLRARSGDLSEQQAWQKLHEGFGRGKRATVEGTTLAERGKGRRSFMRIYWSGVVMALGIDLSLRTSSNNQQSLDTVLKQFSECCLEDQVVWSGLDFMKKLDQISNTTLFTQQYRAMIRSTSFPPHEELYAQLGIDVISGRVVLDDAEIYRTRRSRIMSVPHSK